MKRGTHVNQNDKKLIHNALIALLGLARHGKVEYLENLANQALEALERLTTETFTIEELQDTVGDTP